eukprot:c10076_g1_i1.p1 GENE.c10076_g1_i1~~c10076_g1_i1.p1  ORF type:complete len:349 (-),score=85.70 c10076_g1_i1:581-1627(-)
MGGVCSSDPETTQNKKLSRMLADNNKNSPKRLLLLGAGQAGKSTIFKQVKIIYADGFDEAALLSYKITIHANIIESIKTLLSQAEKRNLSLDPQNMTLAADVLSLSLDQPVTKEIGEVITKLWTTDSAIAKVFAVRSTFQLVDSAEYMLNNVPRMSEPRYLPTEEDVVRVRVRTSGIVEFRFIANKVDFLIMDVGGQRGERRKWIHCFDNVEAVLFVAAISEYDQVLQEDEITNRLIESINLFKDVANLNVFATTAMILFLNKSDIFEQKMKNQIGNLHDIFDDYPGGYEVEPAIQFILGKFLEVREDPEQEVYFHVTCATNKDNVRFVLSAVRDIVIRKNLQDANML